MTTKNPAAATGRRAPTRLAPWLLASLGLLALSTTGSARAADAADAAPAASTATPAVPDVPAAPRHFPVVMGDATIDVPVPDSLLAPADTPPVLTDTVTRAVPAGYHVLGVLVPSYRGTAGDDETLRVGMLHTMRALESQRLTRPFWDSVRNVVRTQAGRLLAEAQPMVDGTVDRMSKSLSGVTGDATLKLKNAGDELVGVFDDRPDQIGITTRGAVERSSSEGTRQDLSVSCVETLFVRGRVLYLTINARGQDAAAIRRAQDVVRGWADMILAANVEPAGASGPTVSATTTPPPARKTH